MSAIDEIISQLPIDQLAGQLNTTPGEIENAAAAILPALLGGLKANAAEPAGADSITEALGQHSPSLVEGRIDLSQVDTADGARIASHIFGGNEDQVVQQLGGVGEGDLVKKLIPILAPIVLSYLAKHLAGGSGQGGGLIGNVLEEVLKGASQDTGKRGTSAGSIIGDLLGGLLGGGRR